MSVEMHSILLDGPIDYLIFSRSKIYLRDLASGVSLTGEIIEREQNNIFIKLDEYPPNDGQLVETADTVRVSAAYRAKELLFDTTLDGYGNEGILVLRLPNLGVLRNKREELRRSFDIDAELQAELRIETTTHDIVLSTSRLINFSLNTIALEVDRIQGLALPGDSVKNITIHCENELVFSNHGVVQRVDMYCRNCREHDRYLLVISLGTSYGRSIVGINNNRRNSDRTVLIHENSAFIQFYHPFSERKLLTYPIADLANSGLSFAMGEHVQPMPKGMVVHNASVQLPKKPRLEVSFIVSYVQYLEPSLEKAGFVQRIGVRLLDVTSEVLKELTNFIQKENSEFLTDASYEDFHRLWEFYFETSFIYGSKRKQIQPFSDKVFDTDRKLMKSNSPLIKKILYKQDNEIKGHLTTIKIFDHTLIIQHLNASKATGASAGQSVIRAMTTYFLDNYANQQTSNRYVCAYYRPDNKYPDLVFGKTAGLVNDPTICWTRDYEFCLPTNEATRVPDNVICLEASEVDLNDLEILLIEQNELSLMRVEGLTRETMQNLQISKDYETIGLYRYRKVFVARDPGSSAAGFAVCTFASPGVNLSELTNSVKFFYQSPDDAANQDLADALGRIVLDSYRDTDMPNCVLLLSKGQPVPAGFTKAKTYVWWVLDLKYVHKFREATEHIFLNLKQYIRSHKKIIKDVNAG